jgi:hypothetical protein
MLCSWGSSVIRVFVLQRQALHTVELGADVVHGHARAASALNIL